MAVSVTHLLLLGAVSLFEPVNGYQIRRELASWQIEEWANIKTGSIYHGLTTLANHGYLVRHELCDRGRDVAVYELGPDGRHHLDELIIEALTVPEVFSNIAFQAAINFAPRLPRAQFVRCLQLRRDNLERHLLGNLDDLRGDSYHEAPPWVHHSVSLFARHMNAEVQWLDETIAMVASGGGPFFFAGEERTWLPPRGDAGWKIAEEAERYRQLLGRSSGPGD